MSNSNSMVVRIHFDEDGAKRIEQLDGTINLWANKSTNAFMCGKCGLKVKEVTIIPFEFCPCCGRHIEEWCE